MPVAKAKLVIAESVQSHGLYIALDTTTKKVKVVSDNCERWLGLVPEAVLGRTLDSLFSKRCAKTIEDCFTRPGDPRAASPLGVVIPARTHLGPLQAILHRTSELLVVEVEPSSGIAAALFHNYHLRLRWTVEEMEQTTNIKRLCAKVVTEIREMTNFDRVVVYRFDPEWNGEIIAEARAEELTSILGLHYGAADIPAKVRDHCSVHWLRFIADRDDVPSKLVSDDPSLRLARSRFDLSNAALRSVSPIHFDYLRNIGAVAAMTVSLLQGGQLWGLIVCHHHSPHFVPYEVRLACESLGQILSWQIASKEHSQRNANRESAARALSEVLAIASNDQNFVDALTASPQPFLDLVQADGAAIHFRGETRIFGRTPTANEVDELINWLRAEHAGETFVTDRLMMHYPRAAQFGKVGSGVIAANLNPGEKDYIVWFRTENAHAIRWAGDPLESVVDDAGFPAARASFMPYTERIRHKSLPWLEWQVDHARRLVFLLMGSILERADEMRLLNQELRESSQAKDEFLAMVSHELKTPLTSIMGWIQLMKAGLLSARESANAIARMEKSAEAQLRIIDDLLDVSRVISGKMRLQTLIIDPEIALRDAIASVQPAILSKGVNLLTTTQALAGPISADPVRLQQIFWNLLSNASKFTPRGGRIEVRLERIASHVVLTVSDTGVGIPEELLPHVFERFRQGSSSLARTHQGLGLGLAITKQLVDLHGGALEASSRGEGHGSTFIVRFPLSPVRMENATTGLSECGHSLVEAEDDVTRTEGCLKETVEGLRVLLVEDEEASLEVLRTVLGKYDVKVTAAQSAREALDTARKGDFDVIVSDIGMPEMNGFDFLTELRSQTEGKTATTPAIALSAHASESDRMRAFRVGFQAHIHKPVNIEHLLSVLGEVAHARPASFVL
jgi:chemotaxis family two-component system sensor kinase Cph1